MKLSLRNIASILLIVALVGAGLLVAVDSNSVKAKASADYISISLEEPEQSAPESRVPYYLGGGKYSLDDPTWSPYYVDSQGKTQPINSEITGNIMDKAGYTFRLLQTTFNAGQIAEFGVGGQTMRLQPMPLQWTNDLDQITQIAAPRAVSGVTTNAPIDAKSETSAKQGSVKWTGAYGTNRDFEWITMPTRLAKVLTIKTASNLPTPSATIRNGGNPVLRFSFIIAPSSGVSIYVDNILWTQGNNTKVQTFDNVEFRNSITNETLWRIPEMYYWDANGKQGESIKTIRKSGSNLYIDIRVPYSWLQSATYPICIDADVAIETSAHDYPYTFALRGGPFWTSTTVGYVIYADSSNDLKYRKTSDGGANWAAAANIRTGQIIGYDCWAGWQTAGDVGTKIHIAYMDTDTNDTRYVYLDTATDTVGGDDLIKADTMTTNTGWAYNACSITKTRGGKFDVAFHMTDGVGNYNYRFYTSPDADTWTSKASPWEGVSDYCLLFPGNEADNNDTWSAHWDVSANEISFKVYDDSANSWAETAIASATEATSYFQMDGQVRLSDGHLILVFWNIFDDAGADLQVYDINGAASITAKTNIITNEAESFTVSVFVNQVNDDLYVAYCSGTAAASDVKVFYQKSTDGGANWGGETAMQADAEDDERWVSSGCIKASLGGKFQPVWFNDDLNDIFCSTTNGITIETYDITNSPSTKAFGIVAASSTYYAKGSAPSNPVTDGECTYTLTSTGSGTTDIDVHGHSFTGGAGLTLTSNAPGSNEVRITLYQTGTNPANGVVLTTSNQEFISNLASAAHTHFDFKLETGTFTDGTEKTGIITLTGRAP